MVLCLTALSVFVGLNYVPTRNEGDIVFSPDPIRIGTGISKMIFIKLARIGHCDMLKS